MDLGEVISKAWNIIWKHKILWVFGILASCSGQGYGNGTRYSINGNDNNQNPEWGNGDFNFLLPTWLRDFFNALSERLSNLTDGQIALIIIGAVLLAILFTVLAVILGTVGRIGLVAGTQRADAGVEKLTVSMLFQDVRTFFLRVLGLNLFVWLAGIVLAVVLVLIGAIFAVITLGLGLLVLLPLLCLLVPAGWLLTLVIEAANVAVIVDHVDILEGLRRGWRVFVENLGTMIVMGLILFLALGLFVGFLFGLPFILVILPFIFAAIAGNEAGMRVTLITFLSVSAVYIPVLIVLNGILRGYITSAWTLTYLRLSRRSRGAPTAPDSIEVIPTPEPAS